MFNLRRYDGLQRLFFLHKFSHCLLIYRDRDLRPQNLAVLFGELAANLLSKLPCHLLLHICLLDDLLETLYVRLLCYSSKDLLLLACAIHSHCILVLYDVSCGSRMILLCLKTFVVTLVSLRIGMRASRMLFHHVFR